MIFPQGVSKLNSGDGGASCILHIFKKALRIRLVASLVGPSIEY